MPGPIGVGVASVAEIGVVGVEEIGIAGVARMGGFRHHDVYCNLRLLRNICGQRNKHAK